VKQEESEHNEVDGVKKGADSTGKGDAYRKERLVICNEEDIWSSNVNYKSRTARFEKWQTSTITST